MKRLLGRQVGGGGALQALGRLLGRQVGGALEALGRTWQIFKTSGRLDGQNFNGGVVENKLLLLLERERDCCY